MSVPPSTPPPPACLLTYTLQSKWQGGFVASVTITNLGASAINGWTFSFTYGGDQQVQYWWNADVSQSGAIVTARNLVWNATIPAGGSVSFGVQGTWTNSLAPPVAYSLNGFVCSAS